MSSTKVTLNTSQVSALLKSVEMKEICRKLGSDILERAGDGYEMDTYNGKKRVNAMVWASTYKAKVDNLENNTLLKAMK